MTSDSAGRILSLECDKGDEFAYIDAERVQRGDLKSFLPFSCWKGKRAFEFSYRVGPLPSLAQVLSSPIDASYVHVIVGSLLRMMRECEGNGLSRLRVVFDLSHVFLDPAGAALRFVYVPMQSYVSPAGESDLLAGLCRAARVPAADQPLIAAIWDYACRTTIITSVGFEAFLENWGFRVDRGSAARRPAEPYSSAPDGRTSHGWDFIGFARQQSAVGDGCGVPEPESDGGRVMRMVRVSNGERYDLAEGVFEVGRSPSCAIALDDAPSVSRRHAKVVVGADCWSVADLGSSNGVFVNGARIEPGLEVPVTQGDAIAFGAEEFRITNVFPVEGLARLRLKNDSR